jgi:hypothetical protein
MAVGVMVTEIGESEIRIGNIDFPEF